MTGLSAHGVRLGYDRRIVVDDLTVEIPPRQITAIVGPNACGKSTLLKALARLLSPAAGAVHLDGADIARLPTRQVATRVGILPQGATAPTGITVSDLVGRGRYPHQRWLRPWSAADDEAVTEAMTATGTLDLAARAVDELSGGQRQRVWIAMALAQQTPILLLDEPTTYLDLAHQLEILDLVLDLNQSDGRTVVLVLHDLNQAARYAHHLVALRDGRIVAEGPPARVLTEELVERVYGVPARVVPDPVTGTPMVVPMGRHHTVVPAQRAG